MFCVIMQALRGAREIILPLQAHELQLNDFEVGLVVSLSALIDMLLFPISGVLMDRYGRKYSGVPAVLVMGIAFVTLRWANNLGTLIAVGAALGIGNALSSGLVLTIGSDLAPGVGTAEFLGIYRLITDVGALCGPLLVGIVSDHSDLATSALLSGLLGGVGSLWMLVFMRETLIKESAVPFGKMPDEPEPQSRANEAGLPSETDTASSSGDKETDKGEQTAPVVMISVSGAGASD